LDRHDVANAWNLANLSGVVDGKFAAGWAETIFLKDNQSPLRLLVLGEAFQSLLHRSDETEHEHRHGRS